MKNKPAFSPKNTARDTSRSKNSILSAALIEFSAHGHAGARIDRIARQAKVSKPLIYAFFGNKDALYTAALREAYVQIRVREQALNLDEMDPETAIRALVRFTLQHFKSNPWFVSILNTENLRGGKSIREIEDLAEKRSDVVNKLDKILQRGVQTGVFRAGVDPLNFYIAIASLCFFPISNRYTLRTVFDCPIDDAWLEQKAEDAAEMALKFLYP